MEESRVKKKKVTISLSDKTIKIANNLEILTDADTASEVYRNALRIHYKLLESIRTGDKLIIRHENGDEEAVPLTIFAPQN